MENCAKNHVADGSNDGGRVRCAHALLLNATWILYCALVLHQQFSLLLAASRLRLVCVLLRPGDCPVNGPVLRALRHGWVD